MLRYITFLSMIVIINSCTTRRNQDEEVTELKSSENTKTQLSEKADTAEYTLDSETSLEIYQTMLKANANQTDPIIVKE
ncbi:MAG: hypothetical protein D3907_03790, partial [Candidatus Electrothrix sp. AUS3]|nr:hypothetical protein [Candidatus Electrothrix gigas]